MIEIELNNIKLKFETSPKVFSPVNIDRGTLAMLSKVEITNNDKVLDLGCGYGVVGIYASKFAAPDQVVMCDVSEEAVMLSQRNAELNYSGGIKILVSNALDAIEDMGFTLILSNPPYHEDFSVPKNFIEQGYKKLAVGGRLFMVTKRKEWYKRKLISVFGGVKISETDGYFVFEARKSTVAKPKSGNRGTEKRTMSKKLARKMNSKPVITRAKSKKCCARTLGNG